MTHEAEIVQYLDALYGNCDHGNIVLIEPSRKTVSAVFSTNQLDLVAAHIAAKPLDLFIKINLMDHAATIQRSQFGIGGAAEVSAIVSFHCDADAGKPGYLAPNDMLDAIGKMPLQPSMIIQSNGDDGGFHPYWILDKPHDITDETDRKRCQAISTRWLEKLRTHAGTIDSTANIDRILRPVGSLRESGNYVKPLLFNPTRRYSLDQFVLPEIERPEAPIYNSEPRQHDGESVIEKYLGAVGLNSVAAILSRQGYQRCGREGFWIRPNSESGAPTGEIFVKDNREGFTVKSGAADPLECTNKNGSTGNWYSVPALWVAFHHDGDWKQAAKECHEYFGQQKPKVDYRDFEIPPATGKTEAGSQGQQQEKPKPEQPRVTTSATSLLDAYFNKIEANALPQLVKQYAALEGIEIGPGLLTVVGAPPGAGKTALAMQVTFDALALDPSLTAVVANAETTFDGLLRREFTRITRLKSDDIRFGNLTEYDMTLLRKAKTELSPRLARVEVLDDPCTLAKLLMLRSEPPGLLVVDYLQKFAPADKDVRQGVGEVVSGMRMLAKAGWAVLCLSATARNKDGKHDSKSLSLSSFKESGEIEFNADSAYVLVDNGPLDESKEYIRHVTLSHVKNRHGAKVNRELQFHMPRMSFEAMPQVEPVAIGDDDDFAPWRGN